jgi:outer membrane protein assembly factor BamD
VLIRGHSSDLSLLRRVTLALVVVSLLGGCAWFRGRPETLRPAPVLYEEGERFLIQGRYEAARDAFAKIVERHPESDLAPVARFLVGETFYRGEEYDKAVPQFQDFVSLYPSHLIADLGQYRLARSYFDQMPTLERDQALTAKAQAEFEKLLRQYPESRYAPDSLVKIEACRLRLAQKEVWIAEFYVRQGKLEAAVQRYDAVLRDYSRTAVAPQALFQKADALRRLGRSDEAANVLQRLVDDYPTSDWSRRAQEQIPRLTSRSGS